MALFGMMVALALQAHAAASPRLPAWLVGCWEQREGERWTLECWDAPRGRAMTGYSRSGRGERVGEQERLRITLDDPDASDHAAVRMSYRAAPNGRDETVFAWNGAGHGREVAFYNLSHDYPQRITYRRDGASLVAEIALADGSRARTWRYRRVNRR